MVERHGLAQIARDVEVEPSLYAADFARLAATPGVVDHGLFPPALVTDLIVGRGSEAEHTGLAG